MVTLTDTGLEWLGDKVIDNVSTTLDTVAVGSGNGESATATSLGSQEFSADSGTSIVEFVETGTEGQIEARIEVTGGTEVPAGVTITEIGVFANTDLIFIDEFNGVTIADGQSEEFVLPLIPER